MHTKGEWYYEFNPLSPICEKGQFTIKAGEVGRPIAMLPMPNGGIDAKAKQEANAKLIAAAPDLLEALERCKEALKVVCSSKVTPFITQAEKAIDKATK